jgi:hypothetical protein
MVLNLDLPAIDFHEISQHKWAEIWNTLSEANKESSHIAQTISPLLFGKKL